MRILVISQYFPPDMGGSSTRAYNVVKGLLKLGHKVTVIAGFPHYPDGNIPTNLRKKAIFFKKENNLRLIRVWMPPLPHKGFARRLILFTSFMLTSLFPVLMVGDPQIVWAANPNFFAFFPALIYGILKRCSIVRNVDDLWPEVIYDLGLISSKTIRMFLDFVTKITYRLPQAITPISKAYVTLIVEKYNVNPNKIHLIKVGVDTDFFNPEFRPKTNADNCFKIMYSGILGPGYDFDVALNVAKSLLDHKHIRFVIRGSGELAPVIKKKIENANISNVTLDTTFLSRKELIQTLRSADAFILPLSKAADRGLPTKIFEYQAVGKPIICISTGSSADYISKTKSGIVVRSQNIEDIKRAILTMYENPKLRIKLGLSGWNHVKNNLSYDAIGYRMANVFLTLASTGSDNNGLDK